MLLYNTLSGKKEELEKPEGRPFHVFVCGPTVYDYPHIGNFRTYIVFDAFVKYLRSMEWDVFYLQNITDIDDKIIGKSEESGTPWREIASRFESVYHENERAFGIDSVTRYANATAYIEAIVAQIRLLGEKGYAYEISGDGWYFDVSKFKNYGKLARRTYAEAEDGVSRIDESIAKRNKADFCLWKYSKEGEPSWSTALGAGRPGWHIEDTAITETLFGPQYDLHGGGVDIKFPHHEAEIAQAEAAYGKVPFVHTWMHVGSLLVDGKKMSKSLGNFVSANDFLAHHSGNAFRLLALSHHYRAPMNYTEETAAGAERAMKTIETFVAKLDFVSEKKEGIATPPRDTFQKNPTEMESGVTEALHDDFNTPGAIGIIFGILRRSEESVWDLEHHEAVALKTALLHRLTALGFSLPSPEIPENVKKTAETRDLSRQNKQFMQADALRNEINALGYGVEDTPLGTFIFKS